MALEVCVESSRVESSRVGSAGEGGMGECARGREAGASEGGFLRREEGYVRDGGPYQRE